MCTGQQWPGVVKRLMSSSHSRLTLGFNRKGGRTGPTGTVDGRRESSPVAAYRMLVLPLVVHQNVTHRHDRPRGSSIDVTLRGKA